VKRNQRTLKGVVEFSGVGLHTGTQTRVRVKPAEADAGVTFVRVDLEDSPRVPATIDYMHENLRRTSLKMGLAEVHTVEHLLASFFGLKIDNVEVEIDGPEVPGLDGSALPFFEAFQGAGFQEQKAEKKNFKLETSIFFAEGDTTIGASPGDGLHLAYTLDYPNTTVGSQYLALNVDQDSFGAHIAPARTFCFAQEVEALRSRGLGLGADYNNTLVIDNGTVVGNALRFQNEFVRHKILDLLGDLFLLGADLDARIVATKTGHHANRELVRRLMDDMQARETRGMIARDTGMEIKEILNLLPHRYPFLLIDRVIELEGYRRAVGIKNVSINEPFFQGHWPGQPIMPGVLIIEAMAQLAGVLLLRRLENTGKLAVLWSIDKVKLRKSVVPGDQLRIEIEALKVRDKMGQVAAKGKVNQRLVAEAVLTFTLVDA
jgi:UDP-3-O-[3-hydroxymyristoyl] N-acetylglucosamine deacetylase/3-hydroxyacyl-[acyl-carrier-protein] dehydratase